MFQVPTLLMIAILLGACGGQGARFAGTYGNGSIAHDLRQRSEGSEQDAKPKDSSPLPDDPKQLPSNEGEAPIDENCRDGMPAISFEAVSRVVEEGASARIGVTLSFGIPRALSIPITSAGTATAEDYQLSARQVTVAACALSGSVVLTIFDDALPEWEETLILQLEHEAVVLEQREARIRIRANDFVRTRVNRPLDEVVGQYGEVKSITRSGRDAIVSVNGSAATRYAVSLHDQTARRLYFPGEFDGVSELLETPDGKYLVGATSASDGKRRTAALFSVNYDGTSPRMLSIPGTHPMEIHYFTIMPSGRIVFVGDQDVDGRFDIYSVLPDGRQLRRISQHKGFAWIGKVETKGDRILFSYGDKNSGAIATVREDGNDYVLLSPAEIAVAGWFHPSSSTNATSLFHYKLTGDGQFAVLIYPQRALQSDAWTSVILRASLDGSQRTDLGHLAERGGILSMKVEGGYRVWKNMVSLDADAATIAYRVEFPNEGREACELIDTRSGARMEVASLPTSDAVRIYKVDVSPSGRYVLVDRLTENMDGMISTAVGHVLAIEGEGEERRTKVVYTKMPDGFRLMTSYWAPWGDKILWQFIGEFHSTQRIVDFSSTPPQESTIASLVTAYWNDTNFKFADLPTERKIFLIGSDHSSLLTVLDLTGPGFPVHTFPAPEGFSLSRWMVTPDNRKLAITFTKMDGTSLGNVTSHVRLIDLISWKAEDIRMPESPRLALDSPKIIATKESRRLFYKTLDTSGPKHIWYGEQLVASSQDGREHDFFSSGDSRIRVGPRFHHWDVIEEDSSERLIYVASILGSDPDSNINLILESYAQFGMVLGLFTAKRGIAGGKD